MRVKRGLNCIQKANEEDGEVEVEVGDETAAAGVTEPSTGITIPP